MDAGGTCCSNKPRTSKPATTTTIIKTINAIGMSAFLIIYLYRPMVVSIL